MAAQAFPLKLAPGWRQIRPQSCDWLLIWRHESKLWRAQTDLSERALLGQVGPVDCPIAVDPSRDAAYRYACGEPGSLRDFSEIRAFSLGAGESQHPFTLDRRKWILWMCHYLPGPQVLVALVASEMPSTRLAIQHQLGFFDLRQRRSLLVNLPRDAFTPLALDAPRRRVLFHGAEGYQLVDFTGKRLARLSGRGLPEGRGADFHPTQPIVALGGGELTLWRIDRQRFERLPARGVNPVWTHQGKGLLFRPHSGALARWTPADERVECILEVVASRFPEQHHARAPVLTPDERYAAVTISRRLRRETPTGTALVDKHGLAIVDLDEQTVWQLPIHTENFAWAASSAIAPSGSR